MSFAALGVPAALCARLADRHIDEPFPIQAATLPDGLAGHDICGRAPTGSGKTLAFGLVVAARAGKRRSRQPRALVLTPTRELAAQVCQELALLVNGGSSAVVAVYGGAGFDAQIKALSKGVSVVVACPGRLEDLVARRVIDLSGVEIAVVDEADRMADMGFLPPVRRLLDLTRPDRQTLLFSATLDNDVDALIRNYQRDPKHHSVIEEVGEKGEVTHHFWLTERIERVARTAQLVTEHGRTMVFARTRHGADRVMKQLNRGGVPAVAIHGGRNQNQRDRALAIFTGGDSDVLVATDVAARGIHVDDVACVVHFDPPADVKDYVHRSGRTGRAGRPGVVVTLGTPETAKAVQALQRELGQPDGLTPAGDTTSGADTTIGGPRSRRSPTPSQPGQARRASTGEPRRKARPADVTTVSELRGRGGNGKRRRGPGQGQGDGGERRDGRGTGEGGERRPSRDARAHGAPGDSGEGQQKPRHARAGGGTARSGAARSGQANGRANAGAPAAGRRFKPKPGGATRRKAR